MGFDWKDHLQEGEKLRWTGAPMATKLTENPLNVCLIVLPWAFVVFVLLFWASGTVAVSERLAGLLFIVAFWVPTALYMTRSSLKEWEDRLLQKYAVTNRRVLMWHAASKQLYQTELQAKTRGLLVSNAVSVEGRWAWLPIRGYFVGCARLWGKDPSQTWRKGL